MEVVYLPISEVLPYAGNAKLHPDWQVEQIAESIREFGNCDPIAVWTNRDGKPEIVEGHGRVLALKRMGAEEVPAIFLDHLGDRERRQYALVHNKLTKDSGFDFQLMDDELSNLNFDFSKYGFEVPDVGEPEERNSSGEIDLEAFADGRFAHECEACGFRFN